MAKSLNKKSFAFQGQGQQWGNCGGGGGFVQVEEGLGETSSNGKIQ